MTAFWRSTASGRQPSNQRHSWIAQSFACRTLAALAGDTRGATAIIIGLTSMVLLGFTALGTEATYWYFTHRNLQNAADSAALSAVAALENISGTPDSTHKTQARAEATYASKKYGFTAGTGGVQVVVNIPPTSGAYTSQANAVEVILSEPQQLFLTAALSVNGRAVFNTKPTQSVRAVATPAMNGNGCVVTLDRGAVVDLSQNGNTQLNIQTCDLYVNSDATDALNQVGNATINAEAAYITGGVSDSGNAGLNTTKGTFNGTAPINDPYAGISPPYTSPGSSCTNASPPTYSHVNFTPSGSVTTFTPDGTNMAVFCNGWNPSNGGEFPGTTSTIVLSPGLYVVDGGTFGCNNCTITGSNVTIYLTGSGTNYAGMTFGGNGTTALNLDAPTDAYMQAHPSTKVIEGVAIFGDRNAPCPSTGCTATTVFSGNATETVNGVIYLPKQAVTLNGNGASNPTCSQLISYTATFHGNSSFSTTFSDDPTDTTNCNKFRNAVTGAGIAGAGAIPAHLVE